MLLVFHLGGVGVREHNPFTSAIILAYYYLVDYFVDSRGSGIGVVRIIITALLLSNLRATWIADHWKSDFEEAVLPPRLAETFADKFSDRWPAFIWPKIKVLYYIFAVGFLAVIVAGLIVMMLRSRHF